MTQKQLIKEIEKLPVDEQRQILDAISKSISDQTRRESTMRGGGDVASKDARSSAVSRLRGIAKPDGPTPSNEEVNQDYVRYLEEKYS